MNLELFLARRLYSTRKGKRRISRPAVTIAQWGVAIGTIVMFVSICIIVGFKNRVRDKVVGFGGHIQVLSYESASDGARPVTLDNSLAAELAGTEGVKHIQPYVQIPGMILADGEYEGIVLKGVGNDYDTSFFASSIIEGKMPEFTAEKASNEVVISSATAKKIKAKAGDRVNIYFMQGGIRARKMTIAAIYETHLNEFDNVMAVTDIYTARKLNGWESSLVEEEARRNDFVCWLRNPSRGAWALCLPYEIGGEKKAFYPDFLVVRSDPYAEYVVDILEPHGNQYADNLPKAKALAEYARNENRIGRIQLIHKNNNAAGSKFVRLDLTDMVVRDKVLRAMTSDELDHIFDTDGIM